MRGLLDDMKLELLKNMATWRHGVHEIPERGSRCDNVPPAAIYTLAVLLSARLRNMAQVCVIAGRELRQSTAEQRGGDVCGDWTLQQREVTGRNWKKNGGIGAVPAVIYKRAWRHAWEAKALMQVPKLVICSRCKKLFGV